jgi:hypothetical protein
LITAQAGQTYYILGTFREGITEISPSEAKKLTDDYDHVAFEVR